MATPQVQHGSVARQCSAPFTYRRSSDIGIPCRHEAGRNFFVTVAFVFRQGRYLSIVSTPATRALVWLRTQTTVLRSRALRTVGLPTHRMHRDAQRRAFAFGTYISATLVGNSAGFCRHPSPRGAHGFARNTFFSYSHTRQGSSGWGNGPQESSIRTSARNGDDHCYPRLILPEFHNDAVFCASSESQGVNHKPTYSCGSSFCASSDALRLFL